MIKNDPNTLRGTILLVEDESNLRTVLAAKLENDGYTVLQAANGVRAFDLVQANEIDLILLDLLMPEMGGTNFANKVYNELGLDIPIIVLTNLSESSTQSFIREVLVKSNTSLEDILEKVKETLGD